MFLHSFPFPSPIYDPTALLIPVSIYVYSNSLIIFHVAFVKNLSLTNRKLLEPQIAITTKLVRKCHKKVQAVGNHKFTLGVMKI